MPCLISSNSSIQVSGFPLIWYVGSLPRVAMKSCTNKPHYPSLLGEWDFTLLFAFPVTGYVFSLSLAFPRESISHVLWTWTSSYTVHRIIHRTWIMNQNPLSRMFTCPTLHLNSSMPKTWSFKMFALGLPS